MCTGCSWLQAVLKVPLPALQLGSKRAAKQGLRCAVHPRQLLGGCQSGTAATVLSCSESSQRHGLANAGHTGKTAQQLSVPLAEKVNQQSHQQCAVYEHNGHDIPAKHADALVSRLNCQHSNIAGKCTWSSTKQHMLALRQRNTRIHHSTQTGVPENRTHCEYHLISFQMQSNDQRDRSSSSGCDQACGSAAPRSGSSKAWRLRSCIEAGTDCPDADHTYARHLPSLVTKIHLWRK